MGGHKTLKSDKVVQFDLAKLEKELKAQNTTIAK